ncbi:MAG: hypothetical protein U1E22_00320 [Coriobacteriia bacterium]|nr:hypothetical protein [Coriobacteriia bacterium]
MSSVLEVAVHVLEPYIGRALADTCVRAGALSEGRLPDDLTRDDLPCVEAVARKLLSAVAPEDTIEALVADIKAGVQ